MSFSSLRQLLFIAALAACLMGLLRSPSQATPSCIEDDTGTQVCTDNPRRVVSLYGAYSELLWQLGAGSRLVARTKNDVTIPQVAELPSVGTGLRPNVEYLLALRPDLVVSRTGKAADEALSSLRARGLTVAAFDPRSTEDLFTAIRDLGNLLGTKEQAEELVGTLQQHLQHIRATTATVADDQRQRVVFEIRADPLTVAGEHGLLNELISAAGGRNAIHANKKLLHLDIEQLLHLDPDVYVVQRGPMNPNPSAPSERAHVSALRCVRSDRVLYVDEQLFSRPGPRIAEAAEQLSRFLYPDLWREE